MTRGQLIDKMRKRHVRFARQNVGYPEAPLYMELRWLHTGGTTLTSCRGDHPLPGWRKIVVPGSSVWVTTRVACVHTYKRFDNNRHWLRCPRCRWCKPRSTPVTTCAPISGGLVDGFTISERLRCRTIYDDWSTQPPEKFTLEIWHEAHWKVIAVFHRKQWSSFVDLLGITSQRELIRRVQAILGLCWPEER